MGVYLIWVLIGASMAGCCMSPRLPSHGRLWPGRAARHYGAHPGGWVCQHRLYAADPALIGALGWRTRSGPRGAQPRGVPAAACPVCPWNGPAPQGEADGRCASGTRAARHLCAGGCFVGLALWFTAYNAAQSAFIFQFVPLLTTWGVETAAILTSVAIIGRCRWWAVSS